MTDNDSINLEQAYAHAHVRRQVREEWDDMANRIMETHGDQLVADGVMEEGMWDSIKAGAGKVAGAVKTGVSNVASGAAATWDAAKGAVKDKLMMPVMKMLQQKFPDAFKQISDWVQQNPNAKDFSAIADNSVSESIYQHCRTINEDASHQYPLNVLWAEANRVEQLGNLENAWALFDEMVNEAPAVQRAAGTAGAGKFTAARAEQPAEYASGVKSDNFSGNVRNDVKALKGQVAAFLAANPNMQADGRFKQIEDMISNLDREGRGAAAPGGDTPPVLGDPAGTPTGGDAPGTDVAVDNPDPATDAGAPGGGAAPAPGGAGGEGGGVLNPAPGGEAGGEPGADAGQSGGTLSKVWNWIKQNPGKAATYGGLAALLLFVGLTPVTFLGLLRGLGTGIAQGAAMADPDVAGQVVNTTMQGDF